ncbi:MAG: T9SS type A sorting domain-containing protein [Bacteroidota bacterium]
MKQNYTKFNMIIGTLMLMIFIQTGAFRAQTVTQIFNYTGSMQTFLVPPCVGSMTIDVKGASGGTGGSSGSAGSNGASARGVITATPGQLLYIAVGGQGSLTAGGFNGGGNGGTSSSSQGAGGGGGSDVRVNSPALSARIIVAGGGGGGGGSSSYAPISGAGGSGSAFTSASGFGGAGAGGCAAGLTGGESGGAATGYGSGGGGGGFLSGGGGGGQPSATTGGYGCNGALGAGGDGGGTTFICGGATGGVNGGGGGGGGYYGGGGGMTGTGGCNGGGGGGSSWMNNALFSSISYTAGNVVGHGTVTITYGFNGTGIVVSPSSATICTGSSVTFNASGVVSYTWPPVGGFGGSNNATVTVSPTSNTTYTVNGTNTLGCITTSLMAVTVNTAVPNISVVTSTNQVCLNKPVTMTASGAYTYTWTNSVINGSPFIPSATADYTVTGTNACGTNSATTSVTVNPLPNVTASVNTPTVCNGSTIILNGGGSVGGYTWNPSALNNSAFAPPVTANYSVTGVAANGCTAVAVVGVTVLVTPTITPVASPTAICFGGVTNLSATGATGYTWTPGTNLTAQSVTVSPPAPTTYTLVRTNGACSSTTTVFVQVNPLPLVNASASPNSICAGTGINFVVLGPITNTWMPGGFTAANFTLFPNSSTCYTVTGSNGNCTATAVACITVNASPAISINSSTNTICEGGTVTFTATGNATSYGWQPMNSISQFETLTPPTTTIVTLTGTNSAGCTSTVTQLIIVNPLANLTLTTSLPFVCEGQTALISVLNPSANVVYNWSNGPTGPSISVNPIVTTNYNIVGTNTLTGCINTNSITLAVYISTFSIASPSAICKGETATLTASGPPTGYSWNIAGNPTTATVAVSPLVNTTYIATGTNGSCSNTMAVTVTVNPLPNVTASVAKGQICKFEIATITGNGATSYSWNTGATTQVLTFTLGITTTYTLTGTDNNFCSKTTTVTQFVATCIGLEDLAGDNIGLNVYPNPNNGTFNISSDVTITLNMVNALGQVVNTMNLSEGNRKEVTVSNLPGGIYFISGEANGKKVNKKIVVER